MKKFDFSYEEEGLNFNTESNGSGDMHLDRQITKSDFIELFGNFDSDADNTNDLQAFFLFSLCLNVIHFKRYGHCVRVAKMPDFRGCQEIYNSKFLYYLYAVVSTTVAHITKGSRIF